MSKEKLLLHHDTATELQQTIKTAPHALLISGNAGSGKLYLARHIANKLLRQPLSTQAQAAILHIAPIGNFVTIDQIRELQHFLKLKTTGSKSIRRVVIIEDAHTMNVEAQNALLKALEEPPEDTVIILTSQTEKNLKKTIYSRVQQLHIRPVELEQARGYFGGDLAELERMYHLSGGDVGLLSALLDDSVDHSLTARIQEAKQLISASPYERLVNIDKLSKDKPRISELLFALKKIASAGLRSATKKNDSVLTKKWLKTYELIYSAQRDMRANVNPKLLLTDLMVRL